MYPSILLSWNRGAVESPYVNCQEEAAPGAHHWLQLWENTSHGSATIASDFSLSKVVLNSGQIHFP